MVRSKLRHWTEGDESWGVGGKTSEEPHHRQKHHFQLKVTGRHHGKTKVSHPGIHQRRMKHTNW